MTIFENLAIKLVGSTKKEAIETLNGMNIAYRVVREDDEYFMVTTDYCEDRINLSISDGIVLDATIG